MKEAMMDSSSPQPTTLMAPPLGTQIMRGTFADFSVEEVLQVLGLSRQCLSLHVTTAASRCCALLVKAGQVLSAQTDNADEGVAAFIWLMRNVKRDAQHLFTIAHLEQPPTLGLPIGSLSDLYAGARAALSLSGENPLPGRAPEQQAPKAPSPALAPPKGAKGQGAPLSAAQNQATSPSLVAPPRAQASPAHSSPAPLPSHPRPAQPTTSPLQRPRGDAEHHDPHDGSGIASTAIDLSPMIEQLGAILSLLQSTHGKLTDLQTSTAAIDRQRADFNHATERLGAASATLSSIDIRLQQQPQLINSELRACVAELHNKLRDAPPPTPRRDPLLIVLFGLQAICAVALLWIATKP
jgi:hypothetical protein